MDKRVILVTLFILIILVGCGPTPSQEYELGSVQINESFDEPDAWENYEQDSVDFRVRDGKYHITIGETGYIWGLNDTRHEDVVFEATGEQLSEFEDNAYGLMCRADTENNGNGYYFLVSGDGSYTISMGIGDTVEPIIDWTSSSSINKGQASNTIRAVCIGDYLALYVNDTFVAETTETTYTSGFAGFAGNVAEGGNIEVTFDDAMIWSASIP